MNKTVTIQTGSRLHFGVLSYQPDSNFHFGGVGVMIDQPGFQLEVESSGNQKPVSRQELLENLTVQCEIEEYQSRIQLMVENYLKHLDQKKFNQFLTIRVHKSVPSHEGFGSGTQLGMSLSQALAFQFEEPSPLTRETLAERVSRGARSSLGIHGFMQGGFLVDGGKKDATSLGVLVARHEFPDDWRFVLARSKKEKGISGKKEAEIFSQLNTMSEVISHRLCRIALMDLLPSLVSADFNLFSQSLYSFGSEVGDFFSSVQGGRFACPIISEWADFLREQGVQGIAQSSWGPTCAVVCSSQKMAEEILSDCSNENRWDEIQFQIVSALNHGAIIEFS